MKIFNLISLSFILVFGSAIHASEIVVNDLPRAILLCQESQNGPTQLTLSRDQFGQTYLTVTRSDAFQPLIENLVVMPKACHGFLPCENYIADNGSIQFFANFLPNHKPLDGHLESAVTGSIDFVCGTIK